MKKICLLLPLFLFALISGVNAQRYLEQVFSSVTKTGPVPYGQNYTVITVPSTGHTFKQPLVMDIYQPDGDTEAKRPLVLICHTGNFIPYPQNGTCTGTRGDSACVEIATRLAKMGYVAASVDYRTGWNPIATEQTTRRFTLINAAYRGIQDIRTCIRYFRKNAAEAGNTWKVDVDKIVVWGLGTGGYISLNAAALDDYLEIINTCEPGKFIVPGTNPPIPMVIPQYNGDIYGTSGPHLVDATYAGLTGFMVGDTLGIPNHVGYSSDFALAVNGGGALGDICWWEDDSTPLISFHNPLDPFAPCADGTVIVPPPFNLAVVNVTGSCGIQEKIKTTTHNNDVFDEVANPLTDPFSAYANSVNDGRYGFYPIFRPSTDSAPWDWGGTSSTPGVVCIQDATAPRKFIDTMMAYFAPRACRTLKLYCPPVTSANEPLVNNITLQVYPNPATSDVMFMNEPEFPMLALDLFTVDGRLVRSVQGINSNNYTLQRAGIPVGSYIVKVYYKEGVTARRLVFE